MTKISSLFMGIFLLFSFTSCQTIENSPSNTSAENNLNSSSQSSVVNNLEENLSSINSTSSNLVENPEKIATEAYDLWISFGSRPATFDLESSITTADVINSYVHHQNYINEPINYSSENTVTGGDSWIQSEAIESFGKKYFNITPEKLRMEPEFNSEYGYLYPIPLTPTVNQAELLSLNVIEDTHYEMTIRYTNDLPKEFYTESEVDLYSTYTYTVKFTIDENVPIFIKSINI